MPVEWPLTMTSNLALVLLSDANTTEILSALSDPELHDIEQTWSTALSQRVRYPRHLLTPAKFETAHEVPFAGRLSPWTSKLGS
jgi:hypothetical protein